MSQNDITLQVETRNKPKEDEVSEFEIGDSVDVHVRITEGEKTRIQIFSGTVIAKKHGGLRESFTVRRLVDGEGVERTFPIHSPTVVKVEVTRHGVVRRAKLYFLRDRVGKATRLKERKVVSKDAAAKKRARKRGAKAKAERKARAVAEGGKKKKRKKKNEAEAKAKAKA